jgi:hypothetical protein
MDENLTLVSFCKLFSPTRIDAVLRKGPTLSPTKIDAVLRKGPTLSLLHNSDHKHAVGSFHHQSAVRTGIILKATSPSGAVGDISHIALVYYTILYCYGLRPFAAFQP